MTYADPLPSAAFCNSQPPPRPEAVFVGAFGNGRLRMAVETSLVGRPRLPVPLVFVSCSSSLMNQAKGWRTFLIANAWTPSVRPVLPRRLMSAEKGRPGVHRATDPEEPGKKDSAIRSDVRQEERPLKRARSGLEPKPSGRRQPFMPGSISRCLPLSLIPSGFAQPEADAAAFRRTRQAPFIQRGIIVTWFRLSVNKNRTEWFITRKTAAALIALAVGFAAVIGMDVSVLCIVSSGERH